MSILCTIGLVCLVGNLLVIATLCVVALRYRSQIKMVGRLALSLLQKQSMSPPCAPKYAMRSSDSSDEEEEEGIPSPVTLTDKKEL